MYGVEMKLIDGIYISDQSVVCGDVTIGEGTNIWPFVSIRGDVAPISIGERVSIQDQVMLHCRHKIKLTIGNDVVIGHQACIHGKSVGNECLIGMGSTILDHAVIEDGAIVAAGAVVKPGTIVRSNTVVAGVPAKEIRTVNDQERAYIKDVSSRYIQLAQDHLDGKFPGKFT